MVAPATAPAAPTSPPKVTSDSLKKAPPAALKVSDNFEEDCPICNEHCSRLVKAAPCNHEACERCWQHWKTDTCMICNQPIAPFTIASTTRDTRRASQSEDDDTCKQIRDCAWNIDQRHDDALRAVLRIKQSLATISDSLAQIREHLMFLYEDAQAGMLDGDAASSIVQVEYQTVREQVDNLVGMRGDWAALSTSLSTLLTSFNATKQVLSGDLNSESGSPSAPRLRALRVMRTSLKALSPQDKQPGALAAQWTTVGKALDMILEKHLPDIVRIMSLVVGDGSSLMGRFEAAKAQTLQSSVGASSLLFRVEEACKECRTRTATWMNV